MSPVQRAWPMLFSGLGVFFGYATLRVGPIGLIAAVIALALALAPRRQRAAVVGSYLAGLGLAGTLILARLVLTMGPCGPGVTGSCYSPETLPAFVLYVIGAGLGLVLLVISAFRRRGTRVPHI